MTKPKVLGIGDLTLDYLALVEAYPSLDSKIETLDMVASGGGPAATAMVTLMKMGIPTAFMGKVGDDAQGRQACALLAEQGVDVSNVECENGHGSSFSYVVIEKKTGKRTVFHNKGNKTGLNVHEIENINISNIKLFHMDGHQMEVSLWIAEQLKEGGGKIILDAGSLYPGMERLVKSATYIVASRKFGRQFSSADDIRAAARLLLDQGPESIVVTDGEYGGYCLTRQGGFHYPAFQVEAVNTNGAGDVFHGAFNYGILMGWELEKTIRFASVAAGLKCRNTLGWDGIPTLENVLSAMNSETSPS